MILTEDIFNNIIDDIESLGIDAEKTIITGSVALCAYGLKKEFHDVDIIIEGISKDSHCQLLESFGSMEHEYYCVKVNRPLYNIDIFIDSYSEENPIVQIQEGIYLSTLECIINAKKRLDREKDHSDFEGMVDTLKELCGLDRLEEKQ